jgi:hypothetical protein
MLKQLTLSVLAAALLPACILTTDNTTTTDSISESGTTGTTGTASGTTTETASATDVGTGTDAATDSGTTMGLPTTEGPTTTATEATTEATTDQTTTATDSTTSNTTGMSGFGNCGWADAKFYACEVDGGMPGVEDPEGMAMIACVDGLVEGDKCDEDNGPVGEIGCCTPEGILYFCDTQTDPENPVIFKQDCGV